MLHNDSGNMPPNVLLSRLSPIDNSTNRKQVAVAGMCANITQIDADTPFQCPRLKVLHFGDSTWFSLREGRNSATESLRFRIDRHQRFSFIVSLKKEDAGNCSMRHLNFSNLELWVAL
jgi:hypothetical protein